MDDFYNEKLLRNTRNNKIESDVGLYVKRENYLE